jgi:hypothetical protein
MRIFTSLDSVTGEYLVEIDWPGREPEVHRFAQESACAAYLSTLEHELEAEQWESDGVRLADRKAPVV